MRWNPFDIMTTPRIQITIMDEVVLTAWLVAAIVAGAFAVVGFAILWGKVKKP